MVSSASVEPSLGAELFSCPHCGALAQQNWYKGYLVHFGRSEKPLLIQHNAAMDERAKETEDKYARKRNVGFAERLQKNALTYVIDDYGSTSTLMVNFCFSECLAVMDLLSGSKTDLFIHPKKAPLLRTRKCQQMFETISKKQHPLSINRRVVRQRFCDSLSRN